MSSKVHSVVSDFSRDSNSTFWSNNPMAKHLRHLEAKAELRKKREIYEARERAANRLKPKKLDEASLSRLEKLKEARNMRLQGHATTNKTTALAIPSTQTSNKTKSQSDWATMWANHDKKMRVAVILVLMMMLLVLLFMDKLLDNFMSNRYNDRWGEPWQSMCCLVYMVVAGFVHFLLCYVALMYAFSGLHIGSVAGVQAQRYYSKNVHYGVAIASGGSVVAGVVKALLVTTFRWSLWKLWIAWHFRISVFDGVSLIPSSVSGTLGYVVGGIASFLSSIHAMFLQSNIMGRILSAFALSLSKPFVQLWVHTNAFTQNSILLYQDDNQRMSWENDAYQTTRFLLLYSGFFLLTVLLIFNLFAEQVRADKQQPPTALVDTGISSEDSTVELHSRHPKSDQR